MCRRWDRRPGRDARSAALLHGQRLRAIGLAFTLALILASTGLLGALLLVLTNVSFNVAGIVVTLAAVVVVPYIALVLTHLYAQLTTPTSDPRSVGNSVLNQSQGQSDTEFAGERLSRPPAPRRRTNGQGGHSSTSSSRRPMGRTDGMSPVATTALVSGVRAATRRSSSSSSRTA